MVWFYTQLCLKVTDRTLTWSIKEILCTTLLLQFQIYKYVSFETNFLVVICLFLFLCWTET